MKKILLVVSLAFTFLIYSCKEEEKGPSQFTLDIQFVYQDSSFALNKVYEYPLNYEVKIEQLKLYLSNISLAVESGELIQLSSIHFVDASAEANRISAEIPEGVYKKLVFSIGVPEELNGTQNPDFDAALYSPDHPLSLSNGMYWTWATGYRFVLLDGRTNTDPDQSDDFETPLSIHTGKDYSFRSSNLAINLSAQSDSPSNLTMIFDVEKFLAGDEDVIDIAVDNQSHGTNEALANRLSDNVISAVSAQ